MIISLKGRNRTTNWKPNAANVHKLFAHITWKVFVKSVRMVRWELNVVYQLYNKSFQKFMFNSFNMFAYLFVDLLIIYNLILNSIITLSKYRGSFIKYLCLLWVIFRTPPPCALKTIIWCLTPFELTPSIWVYILCGLSNILLQLSNFEVISVFLSDFTFV